MPATAKSIAIVITSVHPSPGGGAIFTGLTSRGRRTRVLAEYDRISRAPRKGETWEITGEFKYHEKYHWQLHAVDCKLLEPPKQLLVTYLKIHPAFRGIGLGAAKIAKLYKEFPNNLREILERSDVEVLTKVLTRDIAEKLTQKWQDNTAETSLISLLDGYGIDTKLARKIQRHYGAEAVKKLRENPYRLLSLTNWATVDRFALELGIDPGDPRRLIAATEAWLYHRIDGYQDTLTNELNLVRGIRRLISGSDDTIARNAIQLAVEDEAIFGDSSSGYQSVGCAVMERAITERLREMLPPIGTQADLFGFNRDNLLVDKIIDEFEQVEGLRLNAEQRRAVHMASTCCLSVLVGGAGVGKTTVLKVIHRVCKAMFGGVFQVALAGRAAQRIRETTGQDAYTIVGLLNRLQHDKVKINPGDLVIIDESSMLDLLLTFRLLHSLPEGTRLLFVGDPNQLPPIGPGLIFHVLTDNVAVPATELIEVHRQAQSTGIPHVASMVCHGRVPEFVDYEGFGTGVSFIDCIEHSIVSRVIEVIHDLGGFHANGSHETQILGAVKSGPAGVKKINDSFHHLMAAGKPSLYGWNLSETDPVMFSVNDYERELFNGSLGLLEKVIPLGSTLNDESEVPVRAVANFDGRKVDLTDEDLGSVELAYAITIHKAQGSQFKRVVIPITRSRLLDRTLIYTALTRGIEQVIFVGDRRAFNDAVEKSPSASLRKVGFSI
jgi:exodeoxyribonuclease V alpha subunit